MECKICGKEVEKKGNNQQYCGECSKDRLRIYHSRWYSKNRERIMAKSKKRYEANKEEIKKKIKEYSNKNKDVIKQNKKGYFKEYYQENKEKLKEKSQKWANKNKQKINEYAKKQRKKHPTQLKARNKARYIKKEVKICQLCNIKKAIEKHHPYYNKPLEVIFLCKECHIKIHQNIKFFNCFKDVNIVKEYNKRSW